ARIAAPSSGAAGSGTSCTADGFYTPTADYNGPDSFTFQDGDGCLFSAAATVTITVSPVNDAPVAVADAYNATEDTTLTVIAVDGVLANDSDVDSASLTAVLVSGPSHAAAAGLPLNANGSISYLSAANSNGPHRTT